MTSFRTPCMLVILDGWGIAPPGKGNAVTLANTPCLDRLQKEYPTAKLLCYGEAVGLPDGIMGNSEVGHLNIGAGRIVYQDLLRIDLAIRDKSFFENKALSSVMEKVIKTGNTLHLMGLVSDGGVHSQLSHLFALIDMAAKKGVKKTCIHAIMDGRDTSPTSGAGFIKKLMEYTKKKGHGEIATICGRYYAMDRDKRWDRIEKAWRLYAKGQGKYESHPVKAVENAYKAGETDEFIKPVVITDDKNKPIGFIKDGDGVIFFNFRADRAREITQALNDPDFEFFKRENPPKIAEYVTMTMYNEDFPYPTAFGPVHLEKILGEVVSDKGLNQLRIAETEKYAHVTYFFNGGEETPFPNEDRCLIPSPREVATYDKKPEMSAKEVADEALNRLKSQKYDMIILNFANMDMVGHTGIIEAAVKACETVDGCVEKIADEVLKQDGALIITADHGNAEQMRDENGKPHTAHTLNPVRLILVDNARKNINLKDGKLGDIAPTMLEIMGIEKPPEMTGESLII